MVDIKLKKGLGRGLSSLLGDSSKNIETNKIAIKDIVRNKFQPRKNFNKDSLAELTNSIKEQGVIQPIIVRPSASIDGKYEIIEEEYKPKKRIDKPGIAFYIAKNVPKEYIENLIKNENDELAKLKKFIENFINEKVN